MLPLHSGSTGNTLESVRSASRSSWSKRDQRPKDFLIRLIPQIEQSSKDMMSWSSLHPKLSAQMPLWPPMLPLNVHLMPVIPRKLCPQSNSGGGGGKQRLSHIANRFLSANCRCKKCSSVVPSSLSSASGEGENVKGIPAQIPNPLLHKRPNLISRLCPPRLTY